MNLSSRPLVQNFHNSATIRRHSKSDMFLQKHFNRNLFLSSKLTTNFSPRANKTDIDKSKFDTKNISKKDTSDEQLQTKTMNNNQSLVERFKANLKWILIRNKVRPFSKDELGTLYSWLIVSQIFWLFLKTTTVLSLLLWGFNTIFAKELVAQTIGRMLNYYIDDIDVEFEAALIPEWKNGFIKFNNVKLKTTKDQSSKYLQFDLAFHQIEINLSMKKWLIGKGLIKDINILGMSGETTVRNFDHNDRTGSSNDKLKETEMYLINWFANPNYQLDNVTISDSKIVFTQLDDENKGDILNSNPLKYSIAIFNLELPKLRFNRMVTDFLNAEIITGSINNSMFTFHKRQQKEGFEILEKDMELWNRITRLRINSINVKDLGLQGAQSFNWIDDANVDIVADIMLPKEEENDDFSFSFANKNNKDNDVKDNYVDEIKNDKYMVIDLKFILKDLKVSIPNKSPRLSTGEQIISLNELKPVISYVNIHRSLIRAQNKLNTTELQDNNHSYFVGESAPNISIRRRKSYPNITIIQNNNDSSHSVNENGSVTNTEYKDVNNSENNTSIIRFDKNVKNNEIVLHCRIVENMKTLENKILFQETGIYDKLCMELYVDLLKIVEEWEYRNKDDWVKQWGNGFTSQLLLSGFASPI